MVIGLEPEKVVVAEAVGLTQEGFDFSIVPLDPSVGHLAAHQYGKVVGS